MSDTVVPIRPTPSLFTNELKATLDEALTPFTENHAQATKAVEQAISGWLIAVVRRKASDLATLIGEKLFNDK